MTASVYGVLFLSEIVGWIPFPTTSSSSFWTFFWMSGFRSMYSIPQLRVVLVVSLPAMNRSMMTFTRFTWPSSPKKDFISPVFSCS